MDAKQRWPMSKRVVVVLAVAWNLLLLLYVIGSVWIGTRPNVPWATTRIVIDVLVQAWLLGDAVLAVIALLLRGRWR